MKKEKDSGNKALYSVATAIMALWPLLLLCVIVLFWKGFSNVGHTEIKSHEEEIVYQEYNAGMSTGAAVRFEAISAILAGYVEETTTLQQINRYAYIMLLDSNNNQVLITDNTTYGWNDVTEKIKLDRWAEETVASVNESGKTFLGVLVENPISSLDLANGLAMTPLQTNDRIWQDAMGSLDVMDTYDGNPPLTRTIEDSRQYVFDYGIWCLLAAVAIVALFYAAKAVVKEEKRRQTELKETQYAAEKKTRTPAVSTEYDGPVYADLKKEKARLAPPPKGAGEEKSVQSQPKPTATTKKETYDGPVYADLEKEKARPVSSPKIQKQLSPKAATVGKTPEQPKPEPKERKLYTTKGVVRLREDNTFKLAGITFHWYEDRTFSFPYGASVGKLSGRLYVNDDEDADYDHNNFFYEFDSNGVVIDIGWTDGGYDYHHQTPMEERRHQEAAGVRPASASNDCELHGQTLYRYYGARGTIVVPSCVKIIGKAAFGACRKLTDIVIPIGVTRIDEYAFGDCVNLKEVIIPYGVTHIGIGAFSGCVNLKKIVIPESVTFIARGFNIISSFQWGGDSVPTGPKGIVSRTLGDSDYLTVYAPVGSYAEQYAKEQNLAFKAIPKMAIDQAALQRILDAQRFVIDGDVLKNYYGNGEQHVQIPSGVTVIADRAFQGCGEVVSVSIPDGVTKIGDEAFVNCGELKEVVIPSGVTEIGKKAFESCLSLEKVEIPDGVTQIGDRAFAACRKLQTISLPNSLREIGPGLFNSCENMKELELPDGITAIPSWFAFNCTSLESVVIPDGVTQISARAFRCCRNLVSVVLPESVTEIHQDAFSQDLDTVIYAPAGSYGEKYAKEHNYTVEVVPQKTTAKKKEK